MARSCRGKYSVGDVYTVALSQLKRAMDMEWVLVCMGVQRGHACMAFMYVQLYVCMCVCMYVCAAPWLSFSCTIDTWRSLYAAAHR
jgi:hypothetical protein